uniref:Uncharacterized protein n=1 Tax=Arundo donax TaxID=35708 RepID=A0A0A9D079_ARUDO
MSLKYQFLEKLDKHTVHAYYAYSVSIIASQICFKCIFSLI